MPIDVSAIACASVYTRYMNKQRFLLLLLAFALVAGLGACGNKGPLVRPAPAADTGAAD